MKLNFTKITAALSCVLSTTAFASELIHIDAFESGAKVYLTGPQTAGPGETIELNWLSTGFNGAVTCQASQVLGLPVTGFGGLQSGSDIARVQVAAGPAETLRFRVSCSDGQSQANAEFAVARSTGCNGAGLYDTQPIFNTIGSPLNFTLGAQTTSGLSLSQAVSYPFRLNANSPSSFSIFSFVSTQSPSALVAMSVSECPADFRDSILNDIPVSKRCLITTTTGGATIDLVSAAVPPFANALCPLVLGRDYYVNYTFGVRTNPIGNQAFCSSSADACIFHFEVRQP